MGPRPAADCAQSRLGRHRRSIVESLATRFQMLRLSRYWAGWLTHCREQRWARCRSTLADLLPPLSRLRSPSWAADRRLCSCEATLQKNLLLATPAAAAVSV
jgi:hypothetical protein